MVLTAESGVGTGAADLPVEFTSFIGRSRQVADAERLLSASRVVTLTGPGGVGKTRLARRVAEKIGKTCRDGVRFIELADLREASLLAYRVAQRLDLRDQSVRAPADTVIEYLKNRNLLLVLDNCEHVSDDCSALVTAVIKSCPDVRILATSRQPLKAEWEAVLPVLPMSVPDNIPGNSPEALAIFDSVQLFVDRARSVIPEFELTGDNSGSVGRICRDLDGIPLAIELAVVWLRALSLQQIEDHMAQRYRLLTRGSRSAPERHRTLRALVDWSYALCSPLEQHVWARSSIFAGGFELSAIEYVGASDDVTPGEMAKVLQSLTEKSILIREGEEGNIRYQMLETLREYAYERLAATDEYETVRRRHRDWYVGLTEQFRAGWIGPDQDSWVRRIRSEHSNLRVALNFCLEEPGEEVIGLGMVSRIDHYWSISGTAKEVNYWLDRALPLSPDPSPERATALRFNAWYKMLRGEAKDGASMLAEANALAADLKLAGEMAWIIHHQGLAAVFAGDVDRGAGLLEEAFQEFRSIHDADGELYSLFILGLALGLGGRRGEGMEILGECLSRSIGSGETFWRGYALWAISFVEVLHGNVDEAESSGRESLILQRRIGNRQGVVFALEVLAWVSAARGEYRRSSAIFGVADAVWREIGTSIESYVPFRDAHHRYVSLAQDSLGVDKYESSFLWGHDLRRGRGIELALGNEESSGRAAVSSAAVPRVETLTRREREIAGMVAEGMSNREIAAQLFVSPRTVESHVQNILSKLGINSRRQVTDRFTIGGSEVEHHGY